MVLYFAYGSNMDKQRLASRGVVFRKRFAGVLPGWRLVFSIKPQATKQKAGMATIIPDEQEQVEGVIYETDEDSLKKLDKFEDVPHHYERKKITVFDIKGRPRECYAYIATAQKNDRKPTKEYLEHLLAGKEFLSPDYYSFLTDFPTID